jgi:hypothetical protein
MTTLAAVGFAVFSIVTFILLVSALLYMLHRGKTESKK